MKLERRDDPEMLHSLFPCKRLKKDRRYTSLMVGDICPINQDTAAYETYTGEMETVIEEVDCCRDLGVLMENTGTFEK